MRPQTQTRHHNVTRSAPFEKIMDLPSVVQQTPALSETDVTPRAFARPPLARFFLQEDLNFLLTNRIPRRQATLFMGWFSRIESPLLARLSIAIWRLFADDLRLDEAKRTDFRSLHECFVRELRPGSRPVDR